MGKKLICLIFAAALLAGCLCGCGGGSEPTLPKLSLDASTLTGTVESVIGRTCRVVVTEGDSHYDAEGEDWDADVILVTYTSLAGSNSVQPGDSITFTYHYSTDVSERSGDPLITVEEITVK